MLSLLRHHFTESAVPALFLLTCDRMRRYEGAWHMERRPLFDGVVFLESENREGLTAELKSLAEPGAVLYSVEPEKEHFLRLLCGEDHHLGFSRGYIREGHTCVMEGPLQGREAWIRKIDRHKRMARVRIPGQKALGTGTRHIGKFPGDGERLKGGEALEICAGLEIVTKD